LLDSVHGQRVGLRCREHGCVFFGLLAAEYLGQLCRALKALGHCGDLRFLGCLLLGQLLIIQRALGLGIGLIGCQAASGALFFAQLGIVGNLVNPGLEVSRDTFLLAQKVGIARQLGRVALGFKLGVKFCDRFGAVFFADRGHFLDGVDTLLMRFLGQLVLCF